MDEYIQWLKDTSGGKVDVVANLLMLSCYNHNMNATKIVSEVSLKPWTMDTFLAVAKKLMNDEA